ncbi:TonB family protein [Segatella copri]|uniref:TonB family protein n=1 Tax=Segatella copri TaxID=165179 RepID=UPI003B586FB3
MIDYLQNKKYKIENIIGQGGFGITYKAIMKETVSGSLGNMEVDVPVAIKEFFMKDTCEREEGTGKITVPSQGSRALVELYRKMFVKEATNLAQMNHPHIVKVVDVFEENDTVYYVMQYLSGGSLADYVKQHGALDEAIAIKYIQQIGSALEYMHQRHICHYDVKPSNILLDDKGSAMLIDFGISKGYTEEGHQTSSTPVGISAGYAPLEQYQQNLQDFSPATDVYGLAATLFYLLTGKNPPEASIVLNEGIGDKPIGISDTVWHAIEQGMNPRKKDRVQTVKNYLALLDNDVCCYNTDEETCVQPNAKVVDEINEQFTQEVVKEEGTSGDLAEDNCSKTFGKKILFAICGIVLFGLICLIWNNAGNSNSEKEISLQVSTNSDTSGVFQSFDSDKLDAEEKHKEENDIDGTSVKKQQKIKDMDGEGVVNQQEIKDMDREGALSGQNRNNTTFDVVEQMPSFPGGQRGLMAFLSSHVVYPTIAQENGVEGRVVVGFVVEKNGSISKINIEHSVDPSLDKEAMRVVRAMPRWTPGKHNGEYVRVKYTVPIVFRLE